MEATDQRIVWSTTQSYIIAVCCLLLGATAGYVLRPVGTAPAPAVTQARPLTPQGGQQPTPDQLKYMADKQAEPLLAKLQNSPNDPELLRQIGGAYFAAHQFETAASYFERAIAANPSARSLNSLGNAYYYGGDHGRALAAFERALTFEPGSADALFNIGIMKWQDQHDPKAAIATWEDLLKANPNHPRRAQVEEIIERAKQHLGSGSAPASEKPSNH